jgi:hypothetical protein
MDTSREVLQNLEIHKRPKIRKESQNSEVAGKNKTTVKKGKQFVNLFC